MHFKSNVRQHWQCRGCLDDEKSIIMMMMRKILMTVMITIIVASFALPVLPNKR